MRARRRRRHRRHARQNRASLLAGEGFELEALRCERFRQRAASGADDDIDAIAVLGLERLLEDRRGRGSIVGLCVERGRRRAGHRIIGHDAGRQAAFLGVIEDGLQWVAVHLAAYTARRLRDHPVVGALPGDDGGHAGGGVGDQAGCARGLRQPDVRHALHEQPSRRAVAVQARGGNRRHAAGVREKQDDVLRARLGGDGNRHEQQGEQDFTHCLSSHGIIVALSGPASSATVG